MGKDDDVARPDLPFSRTAAAIYLTKQIEALSDTKTQREIAREMGYDKPNILSMFKRGESKIPIDRVPAMAKALHVDPAHMMRLVLEQHLPSVGDTLTSVFGAIASKNERELLALWREATDNKDPVPKTDSIKALSRLVKDRSAAP